MSELTLKKVPSADDRALPVFGEIDRLMQAIERRARELFEEHGSRTGHSLDDWLQAEHEICWPAAELSERADGYFATVALPGYQPHEVELTVTPRELIVHAKQATETREPGGDPGSRVCWSEFRSNDVLRRIELPVDIDVQHVKAALKHGLLRVTLPRASAAAGPTDVAAAA